jgi:hypothetical protein
VCLLLIASLDSFVFANGGTLVTQEQAIGIGNRQVSKMQIDLTDLEMEIDEGNRRWNEYMALLRDSPVSTLQHQFQQYEAKLKGHSFWSIFYKPKREAGRGFKGGGATVLIDSETGRVIIAIRGE